MSESGSATAILRLYHRRIAEMLDRFAQQGDDPPDPPETRGKLLLEMVRHEVMETMFLYPAVLDVLPHSEGLVEYGLAELGHIHALMQAVEAMPPNDLRFADKARQLQSHVRQHAEDQETSLFPRLEDLIDDEDLRTLGTRMTPAAASGASQPHPNPSGEHGPLLKPRPGLVDELRSQVVATQLAM